jgi:hypothetical protein
MTDMDRKVTRQMKWLSAAVVVLVLLMAANFYLAIVKPNETTQTIVGPIGPRGEFGQRGEKGEKGDPGEQGPQGITGMRGDVGPIGPTGPSGRDGKDGLNGLNGADGKDGVNGQNGTNGVDGRTPEYSCQENTAMWKYTDETTWRPWFKVLSCPEPEAELISE